MCECRRCLLRQLLALVAPVVAEADRRSTDRMLAGAYAGGAAYAERCAARARA